MPKGLERDLGLWAALADAGETVVVAMHERTTPERERTLPTVAASAAARTDGRVHAVRFEAVPEQLSLSSATDVDDADRTFESRTEAPAAELPAEIRPREIVAHDLPRAVVNDAPEVAADLLVGGWEPERTHAELLGATSTDPWTTPPATRSSSPTGGSRPSTR